jgi:predicted ArsR family transcriptional regulator
VGTKRQPATPAEAKALAHPLRLRILRLCLDEPLTNRELADELGRDPGTVLHHVRMLVDEGFLVAAEPRRGRRGSREKPYLATRKSWVLDFEAADRSGSVAVAVAQAFAAELGRIEPSDLLTSSRLGVRLRPADLDELTGRLEELVRDIEQRDDPDGEPVGIYLGVHRRPATRSGRTDSS